jgi:hypothetical protein
MNPRLDSRGKFFYETYIKENTFILVLLLKGKGKTLNLESLYKR